MNIITQIAYLIASIFFILGLKKLGSAKTARQGNQFAMIAMLIAVVVTLLDKGIVDFQYIIIGIVVGSLIGAIVAKKVEMTSMPQMVAIFNGLGGGASAFVALAEYYGADSVAIFSYDVSVAMLLSLFIGALTLTGSFIAFGKLQGFITSAPVVFGGQQIINLLLFVGFIGLSGYFVFDPTQEIDLLIILGIASLLGVLLVIPIGGADMPVVISLLNSYSGIAAATTGFVLGNNILIISGALVGASGIILTKIMCVAMNRSLANVIFGAVGSDDSGDSSGRKGLTEQRNVTRYTPEDAVLMLENAQSIIVVPGYGLAVAQGQHIVQEMANIIGSKGGKIRYAIHPVAGRMPGHMNVLLAEANVPYDVLCDLDEINDDFQNTDLVLVIGANDVINPAARTDKQSPLYGMPILNVDKARSVMIFKRSLSPGFAGVDNELFYDEKTMMVFGDAKKSITDLVTLLKED